GPARAGHEAVEIEAAVAPADGLDAIEGGGIFVKPETVFGRFHACAPDGESIAATVLAADGRRHRLLGRGLVAPLHFLARGPFIARAPPQHAAQAQDDEARQHGEKDDVEELESVAHSAFLAACPAVGSWGRCFTKGATARRRERCACSARILVIWLGRYALMMLYICL